MTSTTFPSDPAAYHVEIVREPRNGPVVNVAVSEIATGAYLVNAEGAEMDFLLDKANDWEGSDPYAGKLPSHRAIIEAALHDLGITRD